MQVRRGRGAILVWSAPSCDRFDRCGALPRHPHRARLDAGAAAARAGRLRRHACRPCRAYLRDRFRGACPFNALARHWFVSACERVHRIAAVCSARSQGAPQGHSFEGRIRLDAETTHRPDDPDLRAARGHRVDRARVAQTSARPASALPHSGSAVDLPTDTISASINPNWNLVRRGGCRYPRDKTTLPHRLYRRTPC
ncbi:hypothetical protein ACVWW7_003444 [Bradyrhizobium sp. LM6.9]